MLLTDKNVKLAFEDYRLHFDRAYNSIQTLYHYIDTNQRINFSLKQICLERLSNQINNFSVIESRNSELKYFVISIEDRK